MGPGNYQDRWINTLSGQNAGCKNWNRKKKVALIEAMNPKWDDLSREWGKPIDFAAIYRGTEEHQGPSTPPRSAAPLGMTKLGFSAARDDKLVFGAYAFRPVWRIVYRY